MGAEKLFTFIMTSNEWKGITLRAEWIPFKKHFNKHFAEIRSPRSPNLRFFFRCTIAVSGKPTSNAIFEEFKWPFRLTHHEKCKRLRVKIIKFLVQWKILSTMLTRASPLSCFFYITSSFSLPLCNHLITCEGLLCFHIFLRGFSFLLFKARIT